MRQDFRSYALVKAAALLLTLACAVGATFGCLYCGLYWDSFFEGGDYTYSLAWNQAMNDRYSHLMEILDDYDSMRRGQSLVVWAIREGREVAREVDRWLMGYTNLA